MEPRSIHDQIAPDPVGPPDFGAVGHLDPSVQVQDQPPLVEGAQPLQGHLYAVPTEVYRHPLPHVEDVLVELHVDLLEEPAHLVVARSPGADRPEALGLLPL